MVSLMVIVTTSAKTGAQSNTRMTKAKANRRYPPSPPVLFKILIRLGLVMEWVFGWPQNIERQGVSGKILRNKELRREFLDCSFSGRACKASERTIRNGLRENTAVSILTS